MSIYNAFQLKTARIQIRTLFTEDELFDNLRRLDTIAPEHTSAKPRHNNEELALIYHSDHSTELQKKWSREQIVLKNFS